MVYVDYSEGKIVLTPEDISDNEKVMDIVKTIPTISYSGGHWTVDEKYVSDLNNKLGPIANIILVQKSFKDFIAKNKIKPSASDVVIKCGVINSVIYGKNLPHAALEDVCKYFWKPAIRDKRFIDKKWDGFIRLYKKYEHSFPTGLLYKIIGVLLDNHIKYDIVYLYDTHPDREFNWSIDDGITPDPDQIEAVKACLDGRRGICKAPTGFGKTWILAKRLMVGFGVPTLFIASRSQLLDDAAEAFRFGVDGINYNDVIQIKDGWFGETKMVKDTIEGDIKPLKAPIIVATIQSLSARLHDPRTSPILLEWLHSVCKFVILDESQVFGTKVFDEVFMEIYAPFRIFLSATPRRTDNATLKLYAGSGDILFTTTAEEQIKKGRLCELDIIYKVYDHKLYNGHDTDIIYSDAYKEWIVENSERNLNCVVLPAIDMVKEGRFVLVLIGQIDHGFLLRDMFIREGMNPDDVRFVYGKTPSEARRMAIKEFRKGSFKILIGSTIFDAGVNIPAISGVIMAGAGNSDITLVQRIGRGARNADYEDLVGYLPEFMKTESGKKVTKVVDVLDANVKFFTTQSWNRYKNAKEEFGATRVHIDGDLGVVIKKKKGQKEAEDNLNQFDAQLELLNEFKEPNTKKRTNVTTDKSQLDMFEAFKKK